MHKILLAEDDKGLSDTLVETLKQGGFEVVAAYDGEEALKSIAKSAPDLLLLDIMMPKKDGFAVLKEVKSKAETKKIPVIVLTNLSDADTISKLVEAGAMDYLVKSDQTPKSIMEKARQLLNR